jgi:hypothetical protein
MKEPIQFVATILNEHKLGMLEEAGMTVVDKQRLEVLERVAEEAKEIAHTPPSSEDTDRDWAMWEFWKRDMQPLIEAVAKLEAMER